MGKHLRSKQALERRQQRRDARQYVFSMSYRDYEQAETVSRVDTLMVISFLQKQYEGVDVTVLHVEKGLVLLDSRGRGSFQT